MSSIGPHPNEEGLIWQGQYVESVLWFLVREKGRGTDRAGQTENWTKRVSERQRRYTLRLRRDRTAGRERGRGWGGETERDIATHRERERGSMCFVPRRHVKKSIAFLCLPVKYHMVFDFAQSFSEASAWSAQNEYGCAQRFSYGIQSWCKVSSFRARFGIWLTHIAAEIQPKLELVD